MQTVTFGKTINRAFSEEELVQLSNLPNGYDDGMYLVVDTYAELNNESRESTIPKYTLLTKISPESYELLTEKGYKLPDSCMKHLFYVETTTMQNKSLEGKFLLFEDIAESELKVISLESLQRKHTSVIVNNPTISEISMLVQKRVSGVINYMGKEVTVNLSKPKKSEHLLASFSLEGGSFSISHLIPYEFNKDMHISFAEVFSKFLEVDKKYVESLNQNKLTTSYMKSYLNFKEQLDARQVEMYEKLLIKETDNTILVETSMDPAMLSVYYMAILGTPSFKRQLKSAIEKSNISSFVNILNNLVIDKIPSIYEVGRKQTSVPWRPEEFNIKLAKSKSKNILEAANVFGKGN